MSQSPQDRDRRMAYIGLYATAIYRRDRRPVNQIWYDIGSAATYLSMWPEHLAHCEPPVCACRNLYHPNGECAR
jgi:hypothetical protein